MSMANRCTIVTIQKVLEKGDFAKGRRRMKRFFKKMICGLTLSAVLVGITACGPSNGMMREEQVQQENQEDTNQGENRLSYLTGLPIANALYNQRPLAVMFNNIQEGCPQAGMKCRWKGGLPG